MLRDARHARDMHGGNGISDEFHVMRHMVKEPKLMLNKQSHGLRRLLQISDVLGLFCDKMIESGVATDHALGNLVTGASDGRKMMLLDEKQVVLNELVVAYREAADHFTDANEYLEGEELNKLFDSIREGHNKAADELSEIVRKTGVLPRAQHADREQVHQIVTHVKAALSEDDRQVFLNDRIENERQIEHLIRESLKVTLPAETQAMLERLLIREFEVLAKLDWALNDCTRT